MLSAPAPRPSTSRPRTFPAIIAGGFLEGRGDKINDPLHARCIVLDDGKTKIAFAIVDTCMMTQSLIDEAKQLASRQCGIPVDHMMVSATHTHSAPAAMGCLGTRQDKDYAAWLPAKIAEGIVAATKNLQPARIGWASIDDWEHTHNRRWIRKAGNEVVDPFGDKTGLANMHPGYLSPDIIGPAGRSIRDCRCSPMQTLDGKPLAVLANYSQHYFGSPPVSADYYGLFCKHLARTARPAGRRQRAVRVRHVAGHQRRPDVDGLRLAQEEPHRSTAMPRPWRSMRRGRCRTVRVSRLRAAGDGGEEAAR